MCGYEEIVVGWVGEKKSFFLPPGANRKGASGGHSVHLSPLLTFLFCVTVGSAEEEVTAGADLTPLAPTLTHTVHTHTHSVSSPAHTHSRHTASTRPPLMTGAGRAIARNERPDGWGSRVHNADSLRGWRERERYSRTRIVGSGKREGTLFQNYPVASLCSKFNIYEYKN